MERLPALLLLGLGGVVIVAALVAYIKKWGLHIAAPQRVEAFGLKIEVSIAAFFAVIGVALSGGGLYLILLDVAAQERHSAEVEAQLKQKEMDIRRLEAGQRLNISAFVTLDGVDDATMESLRLTCRSYLPSREQVSCKVANKFGNSLQLDFADVTKNHVLEVNVVEERDDGKALQWLFKDFLPLTPKFQLTKEH
jgi:hypothetical protein